MTKQAKKLTPWFSGDVKPVRIGFYERDWTIPALNNQFDFWNGANWINCEHGIPISGLFSQCRPWRGLAQRPTK